MTLRRLAVLNALLVGAALSLAIVPSHGYARPDDKPAADKPAAPVTEDVLYTTDGRELHGQIISETKSQVVFEAKLNNSKARLTFTMDQIAHIDRKVAVIEPSKPASTADTAKTDDKGKPADAVRTDYGASRVQTDSPNVPSFYIVPMKGQMGTDVNSEVYEKVREDVRLRKPDVVVIQLDCQDIEDALYSLKGKEERGLADMDDFRKLVNIFQDDLRQFKQVCWVHDSVGISSVVAMTWPTMYMKSTGRLGGMIAAKDQTGFDRWADDDVRGKMTAAFMAWIQGFLISGNYSTMLADAMVRPQFQLSATWKGREVLWSLDDKGEYVVDSNDKRTTEFRAKSAEDFCISKGTADTLDDVALLLGYREYRVLDGQAEKICKDYIDDWRRAYEDAQVLFKDYQQFMGWASGEDEAKYLGKAKAALEKVVSYIERYKPVATRLSRDFGVAKDDLIVNIELIKERLRALKNREKAGSSSGGGGRMGGRGGGMGSPGPPH